MELQRPSVVCMATTNLVANCLHIARQASREYVHQSFWAEQRGKIADRLKLLGFHCGASDAALMSHKLDRAIQRSDGAGGWGLGGGGGGVDCSGWGTE